MSKEVLYISQAAAKNCYRYDAFGNVLENREDISNRILYTGQQYDQEAGQYYLRARFYNPVIGRFTQEDTYRGDGLNLYAYCENNPVMYYDPSGHDKQPDQAGSEKQKSAGESGSGTVNTPYGTAIQSNTKEAMQVKGYVENGGMVYRGGTLNRSKIADAQFWAPESPLTSGYADKYGVDFSQMDYVIGGYVKEGTEFITRPAPGLENNIGGAIEIVTPPNSVDIKYFYMVGGQ